jgi:RNA polymerase sigma-70 factor (ECF subfamily)
VRLFDSGKKFTADITSKIVAVQSAELSLEQRRRDVYDSHRHRIFALSFYMTGNEMEAESLLTNTFVRAFQSAPVPDAAVVDRALLDGLREQFPLTEFPPAPRPESTDALGNRNVLRTEMEIAIQELPASERLVFLLRDVEGYTPAAIADLLQISEPKVQRALMTARIRLRHLLTAGRREEREAA